MSSRAAPGDFITKLFGRNEVAEQTEYPTEEKAPAYSTSKGATEGTEGVPEGGPEGNTESSGSDTESEILQQGVKQAEAVAAAWTKKALVMAYAGYVDFFLISSLRERFSENLRDLVSYLTGV